MVIVKVKKIGDVETPKYAHQGDAAFDVCANEGCILAPGERRLIGTGLCFEIPQGYELQIRPRSGLAIKHGISIVNSPGTLDSGYRGELGVILINHGHGNFEVKKGDRIAQVVLNKVEIAEFEEADELGESERGVGGFGSTGVRSFGAGENQISEKRTIQFGL